MKLKKKSGLMGAIIALSCASLVSVGFASWVISQKDEANVTGNISVDTVDDDRYLIRNASGGTDFTLSYGQNVAGKDPQAIVFGWDNTGVTPANVWLENNDIATSTQLKADQLHATLDLYVYNPDASYTTSSLKATVSIEDADELALWNAAVNEDYLNDLDTVASFEVSTDAAATLTGNGSKLFKKITLKLDFSWGGAFGNHNPYIYYNDGTKTADAYGDEAITALETIEALEGITFNVLIEWNN